MRYSYTPAHLRPDVYVPPTTIPVIPLRLRQRDDNYGISASPRIAYRNANTGNSKQASNRIGLNNNYQ